MRLLKFLSPPWVIIYSGSENVPDVLKIQIMVLLPGHHVPDSVPNWIFSNHIRSTFLTLQLFPPSHVISLFLKKIMAGPISVFYLDWLSNWHWRQIILSRPFYKSLQEILLILHISPWRKGSLRWTRHRRHHTKRERFTLSDNRKRVWGFLCLSLPL